MASDRQISQLVLQVDANIAVAQRSLQDLARTVQQSTGQMNAAFATNDNAIANTMTQHHQLGMAFNNARIAQTELTAAVTRSVDAYGAGASPLRILQQEIGRLSEAAMFLGGGAGNGVFGMVARFLGGPWGIALLVAGSVLTKLVLAHKDQAASLDTAFDKLKKNKEQAELNAQADDIWAHSIDGVIQSEKELADQLDKSLQIQSVAQRQALDLARARVALRSSQLDKAESQYDEGDPRLAKVQKAYSEAVKILVDMQTQVAEQQGAALSDLSKNADLWADKQQTIIRTLEGIHPELGQFATKFSDAFDEVKKAVTGAAGAGVNFSPMTKQIDALNLKLSQSPSFAQQYVLELKKIGVEITEFTERAKNAPKAIEDFKRSLIGAEGTGQNRLGSSAAGFGQFMPSTFESYFKQLFPQQASGLSNPQIDAFRNNRQVAEAVIDAATKDYVSVLKAAGQQITAASLYTMHLLGSADGRKLLAAPAGESTSNFLSAKVLNGNPFLKGTAGDARAAIAKRIGDSSGAVSSGASAIEQALKEQVDKAAAAQADFQKQSDDLDQKILQAKAALLGGYEAREPVLLAEVDAEQKKLDDSISAKAAAQKQAGLDAQTVDAQAKILHEKVAELAGSKKATIALKAYVQFLDDQQRAADQNYQFQADNLKFADDMATTQSEHRNLQLQILDIVYQQKEYDLKILLAKQQLAGELEAAARTQAELDRLPTQKTQDQSRARLQTQDPLEAWARQVPHTAAQINEALQSIEVQGIDNLASSITDVIMGTKSLGDAFKSVASSIIQEIIQMTVKMLIFKAISSFAGGLGGGGGDAGAFNTVMDGGIPGFATGGLLSVGGRGGTDNNILSINGDRRARVSADETIAIIPKASAISIPSAANNNSVGPLTINQNFQFEGVALTRDEFVRGLMATKSATMLAVQEQRRRR